MNLSSVFNYFFKRKAPAFSNTTENNLKKYDVFLCKNSDDINIAKEICVFLEGNGLTCFLSERDCPYCGQPNYYQTIDEALDNSTNLIVICSKPSLLNSKWVKHEWQSFSNELLSTNNKGNIITIITRVVSRNDLPYTLRNLELIYYDDYKSKLLHYIKRAKIDDNVRNQERKDCSTCKLSDAFNLGINIACHSLSFISSYPKDKEMDEKLKKWKIEATDWSFISSPDDVSLFLEKFVSNFGEKWGQRYEDSLYLGSCFFFGSITYDSSKSWGVWGGKIKLQCMKLGISEDVYAQINKTMSSDDILLFRDLIKYKLENMA